MFARNVAVLLCLASLAGLNLLTRAATAAEPLRVTDLVPQKALGAIFFRNINELRRNGDQLFAQVGWPFAPTQLLNFVGQELKVNGLVDGDRPCGVAWFEFEDDEMPPGFRLPPAAAIFSIRNADALADRLGTTVSELQSGKTIRIEGPGLYQTRHYRLADDYLWIVTDERLFVELSNRMPLTFAIEKSRRERMQNCDVLVSFRPTARVVDREQFVKNGQKWIDERPELGIEEQAAIRELLAVLEAMSNVVLGIRVHKDGVEADADVYFDFRKRKAVQAVLRRFNPTGATSSLNELPGGPVLFSHALQADGKATLPALNVLLPQLSLNSNWGTLNGMEILTEAQQLKLLGLFGEVWRQINGYRMAAYPTIDPQQHGLFGLAAVLNTPDPERVVAEIRELAEFLDGSRLFVANRSPNPDEGDVSGDMAPRLSPDGEARVRELVAQLNDDALAVRQSATIRLMLIGEPTRPYVELLTRADDDNATKASEAARHARRVLAQLDLVRKRAAQSNATPRLLNSSDLKFRHSAEPDAASQRTVHSIEVEYVARTETQIAFQQQMRKLLGQDWNHLRLVPFDDRLLVLLGSDSDLHRRAIASIENRDATLQTQTAAGVYGPPLNPAHGAEFHIALAQLRERLSHRFKVQAASGTSTPPTTDTTTPTDRNQKPEPSPAARPRSPATASTSATATARETASPENGAEQTIDFSSLSFTIRDDYLSIEWRLPINEVKAFNAAN